MANAESPASSVPGSDDGQDREPTTHRELAEQFAMFSGQAVEFQNDMTGDQVSKRTFGDRMADAQHMALLAIYHELRHGHDQAARQVEALIELTEMMDTLRGALADHGEALLYRDRER